MCSTGKKFQSDFPSAKRRFGCCHLSPPNFFKMKSWEIPSKSSFYKFQTKRMTSHFLSVYKSPDVDAAESKKNDDIGKSSESF